MKIEEAIKQSHFADPYQRMVVNLIYTGNWIRDEQVRLLKPFGIRPQHFNILRILKGRYPEPVSPGEIRAVMIDKANDLTRLLDKLVKKGWIHREVCPMNRRKVDVRINGEGLEHLKEATKAIADLMTDIKKKITQKEADILGQLLDRIHS